MSRYPLNQPNELGSGARLGGLFQGPTNGETLSIWNGRPPQQDDIWGPRVLCLSLRPIVDDPNGTFVRAAGSRSTKISVECSEGFGGKIRRVFDIGEGLSCELAVGSSKILKVFIISAVPAGMNLYFSWNGSYSGSFSGDQLISYISYPTHDVRIALPEGTSHVVFDKAGTVTWTIDVPGATSFVQAVLVGQVVKALWGTLTFDQDTTNIIALLRPL